MDKRPAEDSEAPDPKRLRQGDEPRQEESSGDKSSDEDSSDEEASDESSGALIAFLVYMATHQSQWWRTALSSFATRSQPQ